MKEKVQAPELRFDGFTDDWEERKLGDISKVIDPHPSHRAPAATEEGIPFIGIGDVNEGGNINYKTARIVDAKIFDEHHNRYDLSIPSIGIGRVASLGKVIRLRDDIGKYVVSPTMSVIQFTNNNDLDFLYSNMNTPIFQKQFKSFSNGSTRQSVGIQDLRILMVSLPVDIEEQQKIGAFFKQLDDTIALHQRKLDLLKEQKKGYLQKMFPKNGAKVPELRFAGFADDWEERKLGDVGDTFTGLTGKTKEDFGHGSAKFVTYVNVFQNPIATLDQLDAVEIDEKQNQVQKGDVFFTTSSETPEEVGMSSVWTYDTKNVYLNSFTFGYRPRVSFDLNYMASMLRSPSIRKKITFLAQGISRYNISKTKMLEIEIPAPNLSEQKKIGSFFKLLDDTIALHQHKLDLLKEQKKGFLQKMFV